MLPAGVSIGDEAEAQTVPYILGIAHPTGFPAYTLAGWLFSHAVPFETVAWRLNAFAALCTAASAAGVFLLAVAVTSEPVGAALAALAFAFGSTVWTGALHANAQVLAGTCSVFALLGAVAFARSGDRRALIAACACCGLGVATHPSAIWIVPAIAVALVWQRTRLTLRTLAVSSMAFAVPLLLYAYLPLRSMAVAAQGLDPTAAAPVFGAGSLDWDTNTPRTAAGFFDEVFARHEHAGTNLLQTFDPHALPSAATSWFAPATSQYTLGLLLLAAAGIVALAFVDRRSLSVLAAGTVGGIAFAYAYRADLHIDRYEFVSFAVTAVLAAASSRLVLPRVPTGGIRAFAALALAAVAGFAIAHDRPSAVIPPFYDGEAIVAAVRRDAPDGSIVVAQWNDATALGYGAFVEHALGSRIIVAAWPSVYSDRYERWALDRPVILYVSPLALRRILPMNAHVRPIPGVQPAYRVYEVVAPARAGRRRPTAGR